MNIENFQYKTKMDFTDINLEPSDRKYTIGLLLSCEEYGYMKTSLDDIEMPNEDENCITDSDHDDFIEVVIGIGMGNENNAYLYAIDTLEITNPDREYIIHKALRTGAIIAGNKSLLMKLVKLADLNQDEIAMEILEQGHSQIIEEFIEEKIITDKHFIDITFTNFIEVIESGNLQTIKLFFDKCNPYYLSICTEHCVYTGNIPILDFTKQYCMESKKIEYFECGLIFGMINTTPHYLFHWLYNNINAKILISMINIQPILCKELLDRSVNIDIVELFNECIHYQDLLPIIDSIISKLTWDYVEKNISRFIEEGWHDLWNTIIWLAPIPRVKTFVNLIDYKYGKPMPHGLIGTIYRHPEYQSELPELNENMNKLMREYYDRAAFSKLERHRRNMLMYINNYNTLLTRIYNNVKKRIEKNDNLQTVDLIIGKFKDIRSAIKEFLNIYADISKTFTPYIKYYELNEVEKNVIMEIVNGEDRLISYIDGDITKNILYEIFYCVPINEIDDWVYYSS